MSPAEAKIAFEKRQRRRERRRGRGGGSSSPPSNHDEQRLNLDADLSGSQHQHLHQHLENSHCNAERSTKPTVNHYNIFCKDIPGLVNDEVTGITMDSHNVDASTNSTPQVTLSSTAPANTRDEQSFRDV